MPAPFAFPGHYWDEEKQKFFKIENSGTAPAGASWSREQVSHQRQRERLAETGRARRGGRQRPAKRTKYSKTERESEYQIEQREPGDDYNVFPSRASTRLAARLPFHGRETSGAGTPAAPSVSTGHCFEPSLRASAASWYTRSLQYKGTTPILDEDLSLQLERSFPSTGPFNAALPQRKALSRTQISCMYVQPDPGPPGFGIVYTNYEGENGNSIKGQYIMTTEDEFVSKEWPMRSPYDKYHAWERTRPELLRISVPSTISYHESSRNMIVTAESARPDEPILQVFSPHTSEPDHPDNMGITWRMGLTQQRGHGYTFIDGQTIGAHSINACVPSPNGFDALCVVGTEVGISVVDLHVGQSRATFGRGIGRRTTLKLQPPQPPQSPYKPHQMVGGFIQLSTPRANCAGYVASVDFVHNHPSLVVAGGRFATPWLVDLRESTSEAGTTWRAFRPFALENAEDDARLDNWQSVTASARGRNRNRGRGGGKGKGKAWTRKNRELPIWGAAHVKSVNENHVVVAGVRNTMVLYDLRYVNAPSSKRATGDSWTLSGSSSNGHSVYGASIGAEPLFSFSNYYNPSRMTRLGFAVDKQLGIVAAAEDHEEFTRLEGGVGLFSLATGERLAAPSLDNILCHSTELLSRTYPSFEATLPTITCTTNPPAAKAAKANANASLHPLPRIPALSFAELPGEQGPSLFAGVGSNVHKFSTRKIFEDVIDDDDDEYRGRERARRALSRLKPAHDYNYDIIPQDGDYLF